MIYPQISLAEKQSGNTSDAKNRASDNCKGDLTWQRRMSAGMKSQVIPHVPFTINICIECPVVLPNLKVRYLENFSHKIQQQQMNEYSHFNKKIKGNKKMARKQGSVKEMLDGERIANSCHGEISNSLTQRYNV